MTTLSARGKRAAVDDEQDDEQDENGDISPQQQPSKRQRLSSESDEQVRWGVARGSRC
jgi:hypothetical protein